MNKAIRWLTCLAAATTMTAGCVKNTDWYGRNATPAKPIKTIGYRKMFNNISAPGSMSNMDITLSNGDHLSLAYAAAGPIKFTTQTGSSFLKQALKMAPNELDAPGTTTGFHTDNKNSIFKLEFTDEIWSMEPEANAVIIFRDNKFDNNLKADSLNTYVIGGILNNSRWMR